MYPVRCFTCTKVLSGQYERYQQLLIKIDRELIKNNQCQSNHNAKIFKKIGIYRVCCKRMLVTSICTTNTKK